jgi:hypothetical protein
MLVFPRDHVLEKLQIKSYHLYGWVSGINEWLASSKIKNAKGSVHAVKEITRYIRNTFGWLYCCLQCFRRRLYILQVAR